MEVREKKSHLWKNLLYTFLGTTLSIVLTFGTSQWLALKKQKEERQLTALMVMGNIEKFAQKIDQIAAQFEWRDTLATYMLNVPMDSLDSEHCSEMLKAMPPFIILSYDKSVENVFSNSIETWKNMGNFGFIDNVGTCFSEMNTVEELYGEAVKKYTDLLNRVKLNHSDYPGKTLASKLLNNNEYRILIAGFHSQAQYYRYFAAQMRILNATNMRMIDISEEEVMQFVHENEEILRAFGQNEKPADYRTPRLDIDSLPDFQTWIRKKQ